MGQSRPLFSTQSNMWLGPKCTLALLCLWICNKVIWEIFINSIREIAMWCKKNSERLILRTSKNSLHNEISTKNDIRNNTDNNNNIQSIYNFKWVDHLNKTFDESIYMYIRNKKNRLEWRHIEEIILILTKLFS